MEREHEVEFEPLLQQHRVEIVKCIDTDKQFIRCYLQSKLVLDDDDCERISNEKTRQDRAAKLLDILSIRGPDAWRHFVDALELDNPRLYEKITGKKADAQSPQSPYAPNSDIWDWTAGINGKALIDFDREFLANQLDRAVVDLKNMTYLHSKIVEEKNLLERKLCQAADDLQTKEKCMEDMQEEMLQMISHRQAKETEESCKNSQTPMHDYLQELWKENMEKSRVMLALQGKVILANEQIDNLKKTITKMSSKNDTFKEHIRELTIINDYERKNSLKLKQTSSEEADELKRELHKMKFKCSILSDEKESLQQELDSFQKWTEVLNSRFDALKQEKSALQDNSENLSSRFNKLHKYIGDLEEKQTWQNFRTERSEHEVNRVKSTLETLKADRDKLLQSLQNVRLARDEVEKENNQLRSSLKKMQVKYENEIEEQRMLSKEFLTKHERLIEELALVEEKAFKAEESLKLARQDAEVKLKESKVSADQGMVIRIEDSKASEQISPEGELEEEEPANAGDTNYSLMADADITSDCLPKRKRDSLIDSIRRKLMAPEEEEDFTMKTATLPPKLPKQMAKDFESLILLNPLSYGTSKAQTLPKFGRKKAAKCTKEGTDDTVIDGVQKQMTQYLRLSKSLGPHRCRCFCMESQSLRVKARRSQSVPPDLLSDQILE